MSFNIPPHLNQYHKTSLNGLDPRTGSIRKVQLYTWMIMRSWGSDRANTPNQPQPCGFELGSKYSRDEQLLQVSRKILKTYLDTWMLLGDMHKTSMALTWRTPISRTITVQPIMIRLLSSLTNARIIELGEQLKSLKPEDLFTPRDEEQKKVVANIWAQHSEKKQTGKTAWKIVWPISSLQKHSNFYLGGGQPSIDSWSSISGVVDGTFHIGMMVKSRKDIRFCIGFSNRGARAPNHIYSTYSFNEASLWFYILTGEITCQESYLQAAATEFKMMLV